MATTKDTKSIDSMSLAVGALAGAALTWTVSSLLQIRRQRQQQQSRGLAMEAYAPSSLLLSSKQQQQQRLMPAELRMEQISRHTLFFGDQGMQSLQRARVCVVGVGGVGSHAACSLARSGLGYMRVIDFDQVSLSSLNRHACARLADVGRSKVTVLTEFLQQVCPDPQYLQVDAVSEMYTKETAERLLRLGGENDSNNSSIENSSTAGDWTMVIDAIDDIPTKAQLIADCLKRGVRVVSCMGAGGKADVTRLHISDLRGAAKDPLATKLRQYLKKLIPPDEDDAYLDDMHRLAIIFSSEKTVVGLADFTDAQKDEGVHQFGAVDGMRIRIIPVLSTMPAVMGQAMAALALTEIGGKTFQPVTGERVGRNVRNKLMQKIKNREQKLCKHYAETEPNYSTIMSQGGGLVENGKFWIGPILVDDEDVEYLLEVWRNRCAVTSKRLGVVLELVRWDPQNPAICNNMVLMCSHAVEKFEKTGRDGIDPVVRRRIEERLANCYAY